MAITEFRGWYEPEKRLRDFTSEHVDQTYQEQIVYVGCVHGGDQRLIDRLTELADHPPDLLIFTGDLVGSEEMEEFKRRFYNYVANRSKPCLTQTPTMSDEQLLKYIGPNPPEPGMTLRDGYLHLLRYQLELQGYKSEEIDNELISLTDSEIAKGIHYIASFTYYGGWVAALSNQVRKAILRGLESSAKRLLKPISRIRAQGTEVIMIEGNWDNPKMTGVRAIAGEDITGYFDTRKFFVDQGFQFIDQIAAKETATTLQILLSYNAILNLDEMSAEKIDEVKTLASKARENDKPVIVVGHAEPNAQVHDLPIANSTINGDRARLVRNFGRVIAACRPDEVIYSHQHNPIRDERGVKVDPNAKYVLQVVDDETEVQLIKAPEQIGKTSGQVVVTYVPLRSIARLVVPYKGPRGLLDGHRRPAMIEI